MALVKFKLIVMIKPMAKNYRPDSISFSDGFLGPRGDVGFNMVANWNKAVSIIDELIEDGRNIENVEMGLDGDWRENSMEIYRDGVFTQYDCYNLSCWAKPIIIVNYFDRPSEAYEVWGKE